MKRCKKNIYRRGVAGIVLSSKYPNICRIFLGERADISRAWQFPQGGIEVGESPKEALFRELEEEIGTNKIDIIAKYPKWLSYELPDEIAKRKSFRGQKQMYFLVRLRDNSCVDIKTKNPEFANYKFATCEEVLKRVVDFKKNIYIDVIRYFKNQGLIRG